MTTTLFLVRHGETLNNRAGRFQPYDTPLSDEGRAQARRVAERLAGEMPIHALYSSDLARTMETARIVGERLGVQPVPHRGLRELDTGDFKGRLRSEIDAEDPGRLERWIATGGLERMPGPEGECVADVLARTAACFEEILARHPGERVALISHGWALSVLLADIHGWDHHEAFREQRTRLGNTAVSIVEVDEAGARRCLLLGCTAHLDAQPSIDARPAAV